MARLIPAAERITRARALIEKARKVPVPETGRFDLNYIAQVKGLLQEARDLVKFITYRPGISDEMKKEVAEIMEEASQVEKERFHG